MKRRRSAWVVAGAAPAALLVLAFASPRWLEDDRGQAAARDGVSGRAESPPLPDGMRVLRSSHLRPPGGGGDDARGVGIIGRFRGRLVVSVVAWGLRPLDANDAYAVWLYNTRRDALIVGAQLPNRAGELFGTGPLPRRFRRLPRYRFLDISVQPTRGSRRHSGDSVLRGRIRR